MPVIPVSFEFGGKMVSAGLRPFVGIGQDKNDIDTYYLRNGMKFFGSLHKINDEYVFYPEPGCEELTELADYFRDVIIAWYE